MSNKKHLTITKKILSNINRNDVLGFIFIKKKKTKLDLAFNDTEIQHLGFNIFQ